MSGLRSHAEVARVVKLLRAAFSGAALDRITHDDLRHYKERRLSAATARGGPRSVAAVNRELGLLRRLFNIAARKGWLPSNPFQAGDPLICAADEVRRARILTQAEEARLLDACAGARARLRPLVVCALDTAMRRGEMLALTWEDVDLAASTIRVRATNTKTNEARVVPVTGRLRGELAALLAEARRAPRFDGARRVFAFREFGGSWRRALAEAGVRGFRFHDLRHTAITWMLEAGMPDGKVMKISGHSQAATFLRYVNTNEETAQEAARVLDAFRARRRAPSE